MNTLREKTGRSSRVRLNKFFAALHIPLIDSRENRLFYVEAAAGCFFIFLLALPMLNGHVYEFDDLNNYHLPFRYFYARCLQTGDNFTWIPSIFCGYYLHGEGQVGMYHPLHLLLYKTLPLSIAYNLELVLSYPFMMAGMFLFLRRWRIPRDASMLGALFFTFSGFNIMHYFHLNAIAVAAHIPWLLLTIDILARDNGRRKKAFAGLALAFLTASQLLLGHPSTFWLSAVTELLYALLLIAPWRNVRRYVALGTAKACGILIGAIQLLPHWEAASVSTRQNASLKFLLWPSVHPMHLLQAVAPYFFNDFAFDGVAYDVKAYNGAVALVLLVFLIVRRKHLGSWRRLAGGVVGLSALAVILAMGKYGLVYRLQTLLPLVGLLRTPCRYILLFHFALAVGAAIAFADLSGLVRQGQKLEWRTLLPVLVVPAAACTPFLLLYWTKAGQHPFLAKYFIVGLNPQTDMVVAGLLLFCLATTFVISAGRGKDYALLGLILLTIVDLLFYGINFIGKDGGRDIKTIVNSMPSPPDTTNRVQSDDNILIMKGARLADGYVSIPPKKELDAMNGARLKIAGVDSIMSKNILKFGGRSYGMMLPAPFPRARLVSKSVKSSEPGRDINNIDPSTTALVDRDIRLSNGPPGSVTLVVDRPGKIGVVTQSASRQLLVLSESYHEGWKARIDGRVAPVLRVYGDFMGCVVNAGRHEVQLMFRPKSLVVGAWLSLAGIVLTLLVFVSLLYSSSHAER